MNEHGDLFLERKDISHIQKQFHRLYFNRMQFENERVKKKKQDKIE